MMCKLRNRYLISWYHPHHKSIKERLNAMSLSSFAPKFAIYDVTPVENLFLLEFMPFAPGDYVRVYLYGLMQCHHPDADSSPESAARALRMKPEEVLNAFRYWEQKGLVTGVSDNPPRFCYENVRGAMAIDEQKEQSAAYKFRDFNNELQSILGLLHPREFTKAMEWVEDLGLGTDVVLCIVREKYDQLTQGGKKNRTLPYLFKTFETCALDFAERGIRTSEDATRELSRGKPEYKLASKVLDYFRFQRAPTVAELELAAKWLGEWKLGEGAVLAALKQTVGSSSPSFAYLDRILERHSATGEGAADVEASIERDKLLFDLCRQILAELIGPHAHAPTADQRAQLQTWLNQGFEPEALTRAAIRCNRSGRRTFDQLEVEIALWHSLGITTEAKAEEYNQQMQALRKFTAEIFSRAGLDKRPTDTELTQIRTWRESLNDPLVLFAADCANGLKLPLRAMAKNLADWKAQSISTVEEAQALRKNRPARESSPSPTPRPPQQTYQQRTYEPGFFEDFFADLDGHPKESDPE